MSRSLSLIVMGTHKGCGGEVRYYYPASKYLCEKCNKLIEEKEVSKN